jgi:hypothetical protein
MVSQLWFAETNDAKSLKKRRMRAAAEWLTGPQMRSIGEFFNTARVACWRAQQAAHSSRMRFADLHCVYQPHL